MASFLIVKISTCIFIRSWSSKAWIRIRIQHQQSSVSASTKCRFSPLPLLISFIHKMLDLSTGFLDYLLLWSVLGIRMFLDLPDPHPDQLVTSTDPAPVPSLSVKKSKKTLDFYCFVTFFWLLSLKNDVNVSVFRIRIRIHILRIRMFSGLPDSSGSFSHRYWSEDPDP